MKEIGVLFDLDGTLLDSSGDLLNALDMALKLHQFSPCNRSKVKTYISDGSFAMVKAATKKSVSETVLRQVQQSMLQLYQKNLGQDTVYFEGMPHLLGWLDEQQIPWGIVTNKQARFARPLIKNLNLTSRIQTLVSGDSCVKAKPNSEPMLLAAQQLQRHPSKIFYLGDALRDVEAANCSGMISVAVTWGFHKETDEIEQWSAQHHIEQPEHLIPLIRSHC